MPYGQDASTPTLAAPGTYIPLTGATSSAAEMVNPAGAYSAAGAYAPTADPAGTYSGAGASAPTLAAAGAYIPVTGATSPAAEIVGLTSMYSAAGASARTPDLPGALSSPHALDRLILDDRDKTPLYPALSFNIEASAANCGSGDAGKSANPNFTHVPYLPARARRYAADLALARSPANNDALSIKSQGANDSPSANFVASPDFAASPDVSNANVSLATSEAPTVNPGGAPPGYYYDAATNSYVIDPAGTFSTGGATAPTTDPGGKYSAAGASAPLTDPAGTYSSPYALNRLFLVGQNTTPANTVLSFSSATAVANYFGATSREASLANEFFAGYGSTSAKMLFTRFGNYRRPHLLGANISNLLTLKELQGISGSVAITFQGYAYSGSINLSGVTSFADAASEITTALNHNLPVAAVTAGSSIAPVSVSFTGSLNRELLTITSVSSGSIELGAMISGTGILPGSQIVTQLEGTPGGPGLYSLFKGGGVTSSETITETYGVLTVGAVNSGTVAVGEKVTGAGVLPRTAIEDNLSGSGPGSTWLVNNAQTVAGENMTIRATPLSVLMDRTNVPIIGVDGEKNIFFNVSPSGAYGFDYNPSSLSYMSGTAAAELGLTQASGAIDSTPGGQHVTPSEFMDSLVQTENSQFGSFASNNGARDGLAAWAQSTDGLYTFLSQPTSTPPAGSSLPTTDPAGTWSGPGATAPTPAAAGTYIPFSGATSITAQITDPAGTYSLAGASAPTRAQPGYYVPTMGASSETPVSPGHYQPHAGATKELLALPPTISGTKAGQSTGSGQPDTPFQFVTITDPNIHTSDSLSIQLTGGGGTLADGGGFNGLMTSGGVYTLSGTAAAITHELDALVFSPNTFGATTTFTLTDTTSVGTSKTDAKTTVTVTNGKPVVASVSRFLADKSKLDQTPGGFDILDGAPSIAAHLDQLNDPDIDQIIVSNNRNVVSSVQQLTTDAMAIDKLQNANHSPARLAINDTAADVQAGLSTLVADTGEFASITASNGPIVVSAATFVDDQSALDKIVGGFAVADIAANIAANLSQLNDSNISQITISDNGQISASVARFTSDATAIGDLRNANALPVKLAINDTAGAVQTGLSTLVADTSEIGSITTSFGPIVVSAATFKADQSTLDKIKGGFDVSDTAANLVADLPTLNADSLNADSGVAGITAAIGAATLSGGPVNAPNFSESGWGTNLTVNEALAYAGAFSQGAGSTTTISNGDQLSLTGTASLRGTTSGVGGTLALGGGSATIAHGAQLSVSNWSISGAGTDVTLDENLNYAGSFSEGAGDTLVLSGGHLLLSGAATFAGGMVDGSHFLYTVGTTTVSGLTIGGTVEWENTKSVTQNGGSATIGDASGDEAILDNTAKASYDITDDSGIGRGSSTASDIKNAGLFEKMGGSGVSTIVPKVTNSGTMDVSSGTLDFGGEISGTGSDIISGAATLEFDAKVASGQTVNFTGGGGELALHGPAGFAGQISGFDTTGAGSNDTIEVAGPWVFSGFAENAGGTQGTLKFADSTSTLSLTLLGDYNPADFVHQTRANGSTLITYTSIAETHSLLSPVSGAETRAGEFEIRREATGSGRDGWGAGASWEGPIGHGPGST